jgi:CheY-like chemotaxis protein
VGNTLKIIIADDDDDDAVLLTEALVENGVAKDMITIANDGEVLLSILPEYSNRPCLVFLDLNMPKKNGIHALAEIKANPNLRHIPILVLTTSTSRSDIKECYSLGVNTYFTKPFSYTELTSLVTIIKQYWLETAVIDSPLKSKQS